MSVPFIPWPPGARTHDPPRFTVSYGTLRVLSSCTHVLENPHDCGNILVPFMNRTTLFALNYLLIVSFSSGVKPNLNRAVLSDIMVGNGGRLEMQSVPDKRQRRHGSCPQSQSQFSYTTFGEEESLRPRVCKMANTKP